MHVVVSLTVSESKRLIAKGIAKADFVCRAAAQGILAIGSGSTNGYIIEEITGERFDKKTLVTGRTIPHGFKGPKIDYSHSDLVIRKGEKLAIKAVDVLKEMGPGDVYVKGLNALNYEKRQAGILIGHPTGGTVGNILGTIVAKRICLLHPAGLEKNMGTDLIEVAAAINGDPDGKGPTLWVTPGRIFTEIEAIDVLSGAHAVQAGSGGIAGAEGAIWLAIFGTAAQVAKAEEVIASVRGEPPFVV